jgi:hypothetical protein
VLFLKVNKGRIMKKDFDIFNLFYLLHSDRLKFGKGQRLTTLRLSRTEPFLYVILFFPFVLPRFDDSLWGLCEFFHFPEISIM